MEVPSGKGSKPTNVEDDGKSERKRLGVDAAIEEQNPNVPEPLAKKAKMEKGAGMEGAHEIDEDLHSRQLAVYGKCSLSGWNNGAVVDVDDDRELTPAIYVLAHTE